MTVTSGPERGAAGTRVGILGGSFNPPHIGHLVCALQAQAELNLDRVLLLPAGRPPHKELQDDPGVEHRRALCEAACVKEGGRLIVCPLELEREGPSYTVDTLRALHDLDPGAELTFIAGGDIAHGLRGWREPEAVLGLARFAVAERAGVGREEIRRELEGLPGAERMRFIDVPRIDVSSGEIRRRVRANLPVRHLVPDAVARYIERWRLYA